MAGQRPTPRSAQEGRSGGRDTGTNGARIGQGSPAALEPPLIMRQMSMADIARSVAAAFCPGPGGSGDVAGVGEPRVMVKAVDSTMPGSMKAMAAADRT